MNIEEASFRDRRTLAYLNEKDLLDIIEFLQDDRKQWINQFSKTHNESIEIQKENKQLKERIEYLERSNNRREDTILEQRQRLSDLEDNWNELKENEKDKIILDKDMFDSLFPIGTIYYSYDKEQKFPYGEWEYRGCNSMTYFFKRIK